MTGFTILTINPGSTSTKVGLVVGGSASLDLNVDCLPGEFDGCTTFADQAPLRQKRILDVLAKEGVDLSSIDAVSGRAVGIHTCEGGTYRINDIAYDHAIRDVGGVHHPASLGIIIAYQLGRQLSKPSFFVNPVNTDELCDEARLTGVKGLYRQARTHMLNQKQVAIHHGRLHGTRYEDENYVILHMGGGVSITAHCHGRAIDGTRVGDGQGPISANRAGDLCAADVFTLMDAGMSRDQITALANFTGGLLDLTGTEDLRKITGELIPAGDVRARLAWDAMEYTMVKWTAMMAGALRGKVDAILITGGMAHDQELVGRLTEDCSWIAPVYVYAGSFETEALAAGAERVLSGDEEARTYTGMPVWSGFGIAAWEGKNA
jgi:butyrate kinase